MDEPNFQKAWALENLRPYSAKQNTIDGATGIRHTIKKRSNKHNIAEKDIEQRVASKSKSE